MEERFIDKVREKQRKKLRDMFKKYGYRTQAAIARALTERGYYTESQSVSIRGYISQVFTGRRNASKQLLEGLASLCNNDTEIMRCIASIYEIRIDDHISLGLDANYESFKERVETLSRKEKLIALIEIEDYLRNYLERLKAPETPTSG